MFDLCKFLNVEEGQEFGINGYIGVYRIMNNNLEMSFVHDTWSRNLTVEINDLANNGIYNFQSEKKEFTDDELAIMRNIPKEYEWMARDKGGVPYTHEEKPKKEDGLWENEGHCYSLGVFKHLFQTITSEDKEPVCIDDYVER